MTIKDIIIEAAARSNLVPRKRAIPADLLESAYRLLLGVIAKYNFSNFINFSRNEINVIPTETVIELDSSNITSISTIQYKVTNDDWQSLRYVSYDQFYDENNMYVYSWKFTDDDKIEIYLKDNFVKSNKNIKIIYNKKLEYTLDDELHIPDVYKELFTIALAYKLGLSYPRTDAAQLALIKGELDEIEKIVNGLVSSNKILTRSATNISNWDNFKSGKFIF